MYETEAKITEYLIFIFAVALMFLGLSWAWITGDNRQQAALEAEYQERLEDRARFERELRAEHPHNVWERICVDGKSWYRGECI